MTGTSTIAPAPSRPTPPPPAGVHWWKRPTNVCAIAVLAASGVASALLWPAGTGPVAAHVGKSVITADQVEREVKAIQGQSAYATALSSTSTTALAAPVDKKALAAAGMDPDDLRVVPQGVSTSGAAPTTRAYTTAGLRATILTRLLYLSALRSVLAEHHVSPTASEETAGRQQAFVDSGLDRQGHALFSTLPSWYQTELADRGADVFALERGVLGVPAPSAADIAASYQSRKANDFTTVCYRSVSAVAGTGTAVLQSMLKSSSGHDDGCAIEGSWAPAVTAATASLPVGGVSAPLTRRGRVALVQVTGRTVQPLSDVAGSIRSSLSNTFADAVNQAVAAQLGATTVTIAPSYGTYEQSGTAFGVLPPDALLPATVGTNAGTKGPTSSGPQQMDPFE